MDQIAARLIDAWQATGRPRALGAADCGEYRHAAEFIASAVGQERRKSGWAAAIKEKGLRRLSNRTGVLICPLRKSFGGNFATYLILAWQATG